MSWSPIHIERPCTGKHCAECTPAPDYALEMAYTTWAGSCKDPSPDLRECRRPAGHDGAHASGYGEGLRRW